VCRDDEVCKKVNEFLATGASYAYIVRALGEVNAKRDRQDRVTIVSIRNHCARHFPVQQAARATYRQILERRAEENRVDFVQGVAMALTPVAFFEVVMNKAFRILVEQDAVVSIETGLRAAEKLQAFLDSRDRGVDVAEMWVKLDRLINAVKSRCPRRCGATSSRSWTSLSSIQRRSTVGHPLLTKLFIRASLLTSTTSFIRDNAMRTVGKAMQRHGCSPPD
jgi:hypothetical protein